MKTKKVFAACALVLLAGLAPAQSCDEVCKPGEIYSDADEICTPAEKPAS